ncbi:transcription-repair coupling factor [Phenylobacterium terrae]|uniref:Transcription-repair-coupling factor n=1 Tax=Phenylobacterium terrae TaxID=2665495 RepID=A0ABW4N196_9CAUL
MTRTSSKASKPADAAEPPLVPAAFAAPSRSASRQPTPSAVASALVEPARQAGASGLVYMASSERRAEEIGRALRQFAPDVEVLVLSPWDCLPFDRASPSREVMGRRCAVLRCLGKGAEGPRVLVAPAEALLQKVAPPKALEAGWLQVRKGERLTREGLEAFAHAAGYLTDDRIDEPGEIALLGEVVDIFPAAAEAPLRLRLSEDGEVLDIRAYDPLSQRTDEELEAATIGPASELVLDGKHGQAVDRVAGIEHRLAEHYAKLVTVLSLTPKARLAADPSAPSRVAGFCEQLEDAREARRLFGEEDPPAPGLYLDRKALEAEIARRERLDLDLETVVPIPIFALERNPGRAFADFVQGRLEAGERVLLTGLPHELRALARAVKRGLDRAPDGTTDWAGILAAEPGALLMAPFDLDAGFTDPDAKLTVIAAPDVMGGRVAKRTAGAGLLAEPELRVGDVVIHEDHGLGVLRAIEPVEVEGAVRDAVRIEYHGGAMLLAPVEEFGRIWRYGAEESAVSLDRLHTDAWAKRRVEISAEIDRTAEELVALARARAEQTAPKLVPPAGPYARVAARFPYPETPDQAAAIEAVLEDLAAGRPMNRLVCGDVGFGKTEVAIRAAAAAALCGRQVAVAAPTTVLARQHFETFRRRFAGLGVEVRQLSRLVDTAEARAVKQGLADGSVRIVIGTHALVSKDVAFADLGLVIIDEEQRFGAKLKAQLRELAPDLHVLTMTATPIPRTLQAAMVGVEDVSVIATPPARRRPIRTFLSPFDPATVRTALLRERRRRGQSFLVVPRIEDIAPLRAQLAEIAPELTVRVAHGELPAEEVDEVMVGFAEGDGDVLLATNIIESGLDVPRANTMLVHRADMFGLAQLHQLRGRVGRGRAQGVAYLLTEPDAELPEATQARLSTLVAFDRLGSGLAISARDLDIRGGGDLVGEAQTGHVKLIGAELYQRLLARAVRVAKGEEAGDDWTPELNLGLSGAIPEAYVPDPTTRLNLYGRVARFAEAAEVEAFREEIEDRFGPPPDEVVTLVDQAELRVLARAAGVLRIDAGPKAVALTFRDESAGEAAASGPDLSWRDGRLVLARPTETAAERVELTRKLLLDLTRPKRRAA